MLGGEVFSDRNREITCDCARRRRLSAIRIEEPSVS